VKPSDTYIPQQAFMPEKTRDKKKNVRISIIAVERKALILGSKAHGEGKDFATVLTITWKKRVQRDCLLK